MRLFVFIIRSSVGAQLSTRRSTDYPGRWICFFCPPTTAPGDEGIGARFLSNQSPHLPTGRYQEGTEINTMQLAVKLLPSISIIQQKEDSINGKTQ
jgi:hypothetical protein